MGSHVFKLGALARLQLCEFIIELHFQLVSPDFNLVFNLMHVHCVFEFDELIPDSTGANVLPVQLFVGIIQRLVLHLEPTELGEESGLHICNARMHGCIALQWYC